MKGALRRSEMMPTKTRLSTGDLQRELGLSRAQLDRIIRDWGRVLPAPEIVAGSRLWPIEALADFQSAVQRDREPKT
jgi:hypothetical protein